MLSKKLLATKEDVVDNFVQMIIFLKMGLNIITVVD
jgi:hypothetical protein